MAAKKKRPSPPLPTKQDILDFIRDNPGESGKRNIARAFNIRGQNKIYLKRLLREMQEEGLLKGRRVAQAGKRASLPSVTVVEITGIDIDGELLAHPVKWSDEALPPRILVTPNPKKHESYGLGDRVLCKLKRIEPGIFEAFPIKRLPHRPRDVLGVFAEMEGMGRIVPVNKRLKQEYAVEDKDRAGAKAGDLVLGEVLRQGQKVLGLQRARITERLGNLKTPKSLSMIAVHDHGIPYHFPEPVLEAADSLKSDMSGERADLTGLPMITIDPADARDHDDAVWAEPYADDDIKNGWHVIVAIADVAQYVRGGDVLDNSARERGNSVYFPDQAVPMLPEALSADLCSLKQDQDRPCLAVHMWFDGSGTKRRHRFERAVLRSAGFLDYKQVQRAIDGAPDEQAAALLDPVIKPIHRAWRAIMKARNSRGPLDLDLPERKIVIDDSGKVAHIETRERYDAHRIIEEFMIEANVCAAETLEERGIPCLYRVHEPPDGEKLEMLRSFLSELGLSLNKGSNLRPRDFNRILEKVRDTKNEETVNEAVLRSQSQARYSTDNLGHFGLALGRYVHFTSPIRRYADLLVHRALIRALDLGGGGLRDDEIGRLGETADHVSMCERRAVDAERDTADRYIAAYLARQTETVFQGRIVSATRFGLFVRLDGTGADGLIPLSSLRDDYYVHDEKLHALVGRHTGIKLANGDAVKVQLVEADPITGGIRLKLLKADSETIKRSDRSRNKRGKNKTRGRKRRK